MVVNLQQYYIHLLQLVAFVIGTLEKENYSLEGHINKKLIKGSKQKTRVNIEKFIVRMLRNPVELEK